MESVSVIKLNVGGPTMGQSLLTDSFESELRNRQNEMDELFLP